MPYLTLLPAIACLVAIAWLIRLLQPRQKKGTKQLPGPKGIPFIGSINELRRAPKGYFWFQFTEWGNKYGPIYQYTAYGNINVVVGTENIANDLLRERGDIYSSRQQNPMGSQLMSDNKRALLLPYGDEWRRVRKLQHAVTQVKAATSYQPLQMQESARLVKDLVLDPTQYTTLFQRYASALILRLTYGINIETGKEDIVRLVYDNQVNFERVAAPGKYLVDLLPVLLYLPFWLAPFKQEAAAHRKREVALFSGLVEGVQRDIESGKAGSSFTRMWLENKQKFAVSDLQGTYVMGGLYSAAASTTASLAMSWVLLMVLNPEWMTKLQEELDHIVGPDRIPVFDDLPQLPMVRAVVKEVARLRPVTAGGIPHKTTADDVYNGYFIPKGSLIHPNLWAIHRDPELYPDPDSFNANRWLQPEYPTYREPLTQYPNLNNYSVFGFGRRLCPGAHIAERSLNIIVARIAWACNVRKAVDPATGKEITPPDYDYVKGLNTEPHTFPFDLTCRSPERWKILETEAQIAQEDLRKPASEKA